MTVAALAKEPPAAAPAVRASDHWCTPRWLIERIEQFNGGTIGLDPCSNLESKVGALVEWNGPPRGKDGLAEPWTGYDLVFVNCPCSRGQLDVWTAKMCTEAYRGAEIIGLVPVATATRWWQVMAPKCRAVLFLGKRVRFVGPASGSPRFDSAFVYFGDERVRFVRSLGDLGWVVLP